jgi:hypothetical protein
MRILRLASLLALLAPALAAAQPQLPDQQPAAEAAAVIQPGAAQALSARFFGKASALDEAVVPSAGAGALVKTTAPPKTSGTAAGLREIPDWSFTPGNLCTTSDPDFDELRYSEQIPHCRRHTTRQMKQEVAAHYGVPQSDWPNYEFDHLVPLAVGGNSHVDNLWPQPHGFPDGSNGKDKLEMKLYLQMKKGALKKAEALRQIQLWFQGQSEVDTGTPGDPPPPGDNPAD